jgi:hypothetical protein
MSIKVSEYVTIQEYVYKVGAYDSATLPVGTFVKPISYRYVPKHILDDDRWKYFNSEKETFAYTRYGIIVIPLKIVREL